MNISLECKNGRWFAVCSEPLICGFGPSAEKALNEILAALQSNSAPGGGPCDGGDGYAACNLMLIYECTQCGKREAADVGKRLEDAVALNVQYDRTRHDHRNLAKNLREQRDEWQQEAGKLDGLVEMMTHSLKEDSGRIEQLKEAMRSIRKALGDMRQNGCTCYSEPEQGCVYCSADSRIESAITETIGPESAE